MKLISVILMGLFVAACSNMNCRDTRERKTAGTNSAKPAEIKKEIDPMSKTSSADRVKVYKADGTKQCNQGRKIPVEEMQKQLGDIHVYSAASKHDGLMHVQVCGAATGQANVYEIDRSNLAAAQKAGFKEWTHD